MTAHRPAGVALAALAAAAALACKKEAPKPEAEPGAAPVPVAAPLPSDAPAFVTSASPVRREPSDAPRVAGPKGKQVSNLLATLQRGERVTVLEARPDWLRIRASDDSEGWVKAGAVLQGEALAEATVRAAADVFDRPDLLTANAKRKVEPGTLLLVVKARPPFSEVNVAGSANAWVLTDRLATGERDVSVAKLIEKARWLRRSGREEEAKEILALARQHFAGEPLLEVLAVDVGEAPPPGDPAAPQPPPERQY
ncbi:MAG TPA: SH3 domain-containing protein [Anaeromyxobacter sp.]